MPLLFSGWRPVIQKPSGKMKDRTPFSKRIRSAVQSCRVMQLSSVSQCRYMPFPLFCRYFRAKYNTDVDANQLVAYAAVLCYNFP